MGDDAWDPAATPDQIAAMAALLEHAMAAGAWGLSTSFLDVDKHGPSGAVPRREGRRVRRALRRARPGRRGSSRWSPTCSTAPPRPSSRTSPSAAASATSPSPGPGSSTWPTPALTDGWIEISRRLAADGVRLYPQLSPRTVDFRLNWDSSMMFMSMPEGWPSGIDMNIIEESS